MDVIELNISVKQFFMGYTKKEQAKDFYCILDLIQNIVKNLNLNSEESIRGYVEGWFANNHIPTFVIDEICNNTSITNIANFSHKERLSMKVYLYLKIKIGLRKNAHET